MAQLATTKDDSVSDETRVAETKESPPENDPYPLPPLDLSSAGLAADDPAVVPSFVLEEERETNETEVLPTSRDFLEPKPNDVLLHNHEMSRSNPGNIRFHQASTKAAIEFHAALNQNQSPDLIAAARALALFVQASGGRFLDYDEDSSQWYEIEDSRMIRKCLNELRHKIDMPKKADDEDDGSDLETNRNPQQNSVCYSSTIDRNVNGAPTAATAQKDDSENSTETFNNNERMSAIETKSEPADSSDVGNVAAPRSEEGVPPRASSGDGLSRMLSIGRIFQTGDSAAQLFASSDSVSGMLRSELFRSGVSVDLPPLENEVAEGSAGAAPAPSTADASSAAVAASTTAAAKPPIAAAPQPAGSLPDPTQPQGALPDPTAPVTGEFGADLTKSQASLFSSLVRKMSVSAQSLMSGSQETSDASAVAAAVAVQPKPVPKPTSSSNVGIFTSREWGSDLGPFQDVNVKDVFQSTSGGAQPPGKSGLSQPGKKPKKKRDWNALVVKGLEASVKQEKKVIPAANPADAALFALAAASQERLNEKASAMVKPKKANSKLPAKKRAAHTTAAGLVEPQPPREPTASNAVNAGDRIFVEPRDNDVLLGRGGRTNNHPGNKKYLEAKDNMQARYLAADKNEKTPISQELVDIVHAYGGRFLKQDTGSQLWYEIDNLTARKKCSQTLREINTPEERAAKRARYAK